MRTRYQRYADFLLGVIVALLAVVIYSMWFA